MKPFVFTALHLGDIFVRADIRHHRDADQAVAVDGAVLFYEMVVERLDDGEKRGAVFNLGVARFAGKQQLAVDTVGVLLFQPLLRRAGADRVVEFETGRIEFFGPLAGE